MKTDKFLDIISCNINNAIILERLPNLEVNDLWLVSRALFQTVWNVQTDRAPTYGIIDYDVFYFDETDLSFEAEGIIIDRVKSMFKDIDINIEVRNQARVHLWYEQHFGISYRPLNSCEAIDRFLAEACMVGLQPSVSPQLYAPKGLDDIENMVLRPNLSPNFSAKHYYTKAKRWKDCWPELKVEKA